MVRNLANACSFPAVGVRVQCKNLCTRQEKKTKGGSGDGTEHGRIAPCSDVGARGYLLFCAKRRIIDSPISYEGAYPLVLPCCSINGTFCGWVRCRRKAARFLTSGPCPLVLPCDCNDVRNAKNTSSVAVHSTATPSPQGEGFVTASGLFT